MRNRVFLNSPRTRNYIVLSLMLALALSVAGCGGGGGGGGNNNNGNGNTPPPNPALATVTGVVRDTSPNHNPVQGAQITVVVPGGANRQAVSDASGSFVVTNVALNATSFMVASPNTTNYYNYANYNGKLYDLTACSLALPALVAGANAPFTEIDMYIAGNNPPPPPPIGGCPV